LIRRTCGKAVDGESAVGGYPLFVRFQFPARRLPLIGSVLASFEGGFTSG
jgi:hypothetical protein